jgi:hypothetical protein
MDPGLGDIHAGAKITQLGAINVDDKPPCHLADDAELALTWQHLGVITIGAKLGAIVNGAKPGATNQITMYIIFYPKYLQVVLSDQTESHYKNSRVSHISQYPSHCKISNL